MILDKIYKDTENRIKAFREQGNIAKIRKEQLYFTGVTMGIVARTDNTYETLKNDTELTNENLKNGIKDAKEIDLKDNIIFEAMCYAKSIDELALKKENDE